MIKKAEGSPLLVVPNVPWDWRTHSRLYFFGELGDITRFKTHKQLNAFVGIDIQQVSSQVSILDKTASISVVMPKHGKLFSSPFEISFASNAQLLIILSIIQIKKATYP